MARSRYSDADKGLPVETEQAEQLASAIGEVVGAAGLSHQELLRVIRSEIGKYVSEAVQAQERKEFISEHLDVVYLGNPYTGKRVVGREKILKLDHELVTGKALVHNPDNPTKPVRKQVHSGIENMPWCDVFLPWTKQDADAVAQGQPPMNSHEEYPQISGMSWRVTAGRKQNIPLMFAEALACANKISPDQLPMGNAVRVSLEAEQRAVAEEKMRQKNYWRSIGVRTEDMQDVTPLGGIA